MTEFKIGDTVTVTGVVYENPGYGTTVALRNCWDKKLVAPCPVKGDLVCMDGNIVTVEKIVSSVLYSTDGKSIGITFIRHPTEEQKKEHMLKQLDNFDTEVLMKEILRREKDKMDKKIAPAAEVAK